MYPSCWESSIQGFGHPTIKNLMLLYINFKKPSHADDSELTDDDVINRWIKTKLWELPHSMQVGKRTRARRIAERIALRAFGTSPKLTSLTFRQLQIRSEHCGTSQADF